LTITVTPATAWDGDVKIKPVVHAYPPEPNRPGKAVGDVVLVDRSLLVSLGPAEKVNSAAIRQAGVRTARWLFDHWSSNVGLDSIAFASLDVNNALEAFCEGLLLGAFRFDRHKSDVGNPVLVDVHVLIDDDSSVANKIDRVSAIIAGVNLAREWSHEPANIINPATLAERSRDLAAETGLSVTVLGENELSEMGAGAIISVGLGSKTPSQMIILEHKGSTADSAPVVVVGKAITFDTGGYSLKDKAGIVGMKFDKCGGMAVIGIMQAIAELDLSIPVIGIVAAAENMISQDAYRPNDIITSLSGKTIEIISTDAEGRMVLADALTYAAAQYKPRAIIDLATLTGGVRTALGSVRAGLMTNDGKLAEQLYEVGERTSERLWRMPLDEEYFELIKGADSDIKNSAGVPTASPIVGGMFLKQFVPDEVPWAHIDIAGTATVEKSKGIRLATGFGVRLILDYLAGLI